MVREFHRHQVVMGFPKHVVSTFNEIVGFRGVASGDDEAVGEPVLTVHQDFRWLVNSCINVDVYFEAFTILHDSLVDDVALRIPRVGSCERFEFALLERAILIPEALRFVTGRCGQILVGFELPVCPT